jgi:TetR/AcrR family transcriptional repressor of nem operon
MIAQELLSCGMARPRSFDPAKADAAMLGAFWRNGFTATAIPDLSAATGLLPGSLYAAFGNKDEMFQAALKRYAAWLAGELRTSSTGLAAIKYILDAIVRITLEDRERRGCPMINAIAEGPALQEKTRAYITDSMASLRRLFRARLAEAAAGADIAVDELEALLFSASVSIRVLGRARVPASLLRDIAAATFAAVQLQVESKPLPRRVRGPSKRRKTT